MNRISSASSGINDEVGKDQKPENGNRSGQ